MMAKSLEYHYDGIRDMKIVEVDFNEVTKGMKQRWARVPGQEFKLRDANYLIDRIKKPSEAAAFEITAIKVFESTFDPYHVAENINSLRDFLAKYPDEFFFIVARICPTKPKYTCIQVARRILPPGEDKAFDKAFERFLSEVNLVHAPLLMTTVLKVTGGERPALLGNGYLKLDHFTGPNYVEVDIDVGSSRIARRIANTALGYLDRMIVQESYVIEGKESEELPERVLFANAFIGCNIKNASIRFTDEDSDLLEQYNAKFKKAL